MTIDLDESVRDYWRQRLKAKFQTALNPYRSQFSMQDLRLNTLDSTVKKVEAMVYKGSKTMQAYQNSLQADSLVQTVVNRIVSTASSSQQQQQQFLAQQMMGGGGGGMMQTRGGPALMQQGGRTLVMNPMRPQQPQEQLMSGIITQHVPPTLPGYGNQLQQFAARGDPQMGGVGMMDDGTGGVLQAPKAPSNAPDSQDPTLRMVTDFFGPDALPQQSDASSNNATTGAAPPGIPSNHAPVNQLGQRGHPVGANPQMIPNMQQMPGMQPIPMNPQNQQQAALLQQQKQQQQFIKQQQAAVQQQQMQNMQQGMGVRPPQINQQQMYYSNLLRGQQNMMQINPTNPALLQQQQQQKQQQFAAQQQQQLQQQQQQQQQQLKQQQVMQQQQQQQQFSKEDAEQRVVKLCQDFKAKYQKDMEEVIKYLKLLLVDHSKASKQMDEQKRTDIKTHLQFLDKFYRYIMSPPTTQIASKENCSKIQQVHSLLEKYKKQLAYLKDPELLAQYKMKQQQQQQQQQLQQQQQYVPVSSRQGEPSPLNTPSEVVVISPDNQLGQGQQANVGQKRNISAVTALEDGLQASNKQSKVAAEKQSSPDVSAQLLQIAKDYVPVATNTTYLENLYHKIAKQQQQQQQNMFGNSSSMSEGGILCPDMFEALMEFQQTQMPNMPIISKNRQFCYSNSLNSKGTKQEVAQQETEEQEVTKREGSKKEVLRTEEELKKLKEVESQCESINSQMSEQIKLTVSNHQVTTGKVSVDCQVVESQFLEDLNSLDEGDSEDVNNWKKLNIYVDVENGQVNYGINTQPLLQRKDGIFLITNFQQQVHEHQTQDMDMKLLSQIWYDCVKECSIV